MNIFYEVGDIFIKKKLCGNAVIPIFHTIKIIKSGFQGINILSITDNQPFNYAVFV